MRRSLFAGFGIAAVLIFAACTDRPQGREPLAPTDPSLAPGGGSGSLLCAGSLLSDISKQQKALFTTAQIAQLDPLLTTLKNQCPTTTPSFALLTYIQKVADFRLDPQGNVDTPRAQGLAKLWKDVTSYATEYLALDRPAVVFQVGTLPNGNEGIRGGGADVLDGDPSSALFDVEMFTWDNRAGFQISGTPPDPIQQPAGPHLITLAPGPCPGTALRITGGCYNVDSYPAVTTWSPNVDFGQCFLGGNSPTSAISHQETNYGTEVLPPGSPFPWAGSGVTCTNTHAMLNTWLGREAGPLGRVLARAIDYLRPQPLFADDAGESGSSNDASPFGAVLQVIFDHEFNNLNAYPASPDVGDSLHVQSFSPGYIQIQNNIADMPGNVVVLSQAQGNCLNCPVFQLLGWRVNSRPSQFIPLTIGSYDITWISTQTKPNVKEAPFVVQNDAGVEIARLAYVTQSSQNKWVFSFQSDTGMYTADVGTWIEDKPDTLKITVNLTTESATTSQTVSVTVGSVTTTFAPRKAVNATSIQRIGYVLTGIDAGIIASDKWKVVRQADIP